ncbi:MAG: TonB-dependent receptor [Paludibacteraceae bacterium]|nr:TonB-dependent receptor [Paludibacteraceae bacterium]
MKNKILLFLLLLSPVLVAARTIQGVVTDQTGETIISASVMVKGTTIGTVTDFDGNYTLEVPDDATTLVFSYIGLITQELPITSDVINVVLKENAEQLDEVVVTGYGTTKKRDLVTAVASVGADQLKDSPVSSAAEALQGKLAGVSVTTTEGSPDAEVKIRVRGGTSLTQSNDPLYIVDGFPVSSIADIPPTDIASMDVLKDAAATAIYGAQGANGVIIITLKESAADNDKPEMHVEYNGFVGWKKIAKMLNTLSNRDFMLLQYENAYLKGGVEGNFAPYFIEGYQNGDGYDIAAMLAGANDLKRTNWQKETFGRTGFTSNHSISLSGGNRVANFTANYTRVDDKAIMDGSDYHRNNLNLKAKFKPLKWLTLGFNTRYSDTEVHGAGSNTTKDAGTTSESRMRNAVAFTPIKLYKKDGDSLEDEDAYGGLYDPITTIRDNYKLKKEMRFNVGGYFNIKFAKYFTWRSEIGYDYKTVRTERFYGPTTYFARTNAKNGKGAAVLTNEKNTKFRQTNTFKYDQTFDKAHNLGILLGEEIIMNKGSEDTQTAVGFDPIMGGKDVFNHFGSAESYTSKNYIDPTDNMLSFFARADYNYKSRYYASFTFRADGSTRFAKEHQWGYFPSGAVAWNIGEEEFVDPAKEYMSQLKLRFSYGTAGNNNVDLGYLHTDFLSEVAAHSGGTVSDLSGFTNMLTAGGSQKIAANPNLKWETTITRNLGIDFGFFNQRLSGSLDLYLNTTKDLIILYNLSSGYNAQFRNIGSTENRGIEVSLTGVILDKKSSSLHYNLSVSANISANRNKVIDLGGMDYITASTSAFSTANATLNEFYVYKGQPMGSFYGYISDGWYTASDFNRVSPTDNQGGEKQQNWRLDKTKAPTQLESLGAAYPGMIKLKDINKDGKIDEADRVKLGNAMPKCSGGFSLNFNIGGDKWGQVDLNANFTYSIGNKVLNLNKVDFTTITNTSTKTSYRNAITEVAYGNRYSMFTADGGYLPTQYLAKFNNDYEKMAAAMDADNANASIWSPYMAAYIVTDYAVEDGSFLRLNQLTLGYSLANAWIKKAYITRCRIYVQASNLFCVTKYSGFDPEVDVYSSKNPLMPGVDYSAYPRSIGVNVGVNLAF